MKKIGIALLLAAAATIPAQPQNSKPFLGRWDLTVTVGDTKYASWLEVTDKAGKLDARAQQRTGNVAPVDGVRMEGQRLLVTVAAAVPARAAEGNRPAAPARPEIVWDLTAKRRQALRRFQAGRRHLADGRSERAGAEAGRARRVGRLPSR